MDDLAEDITKMASAAAWSAANSIWGPKDDAARDNRRFNNYAE